MRTDSYEGGDVAVEAVLLLSIGPLHRAIDHFDILIRLSSVTVFLQAEAVKWRRWSSVIKTKMDSRDERMKDEQEARKSRKQV